MQKIKYVITALLFGLILLLSGCTNSYENKEKIDSYDNEAVILGAGRHLAPGEKDAYYCSKILGVWEPLITNDRVAKSCACRKMADEAKWKRMDFLSAQGC